MVACDRSLPDDEPACGLLAGPREQLVVALCDGMKAAMLAGDVGLARVAWAALGKLVEGYSAANAVLDLEEERAARKKP